MHIQTILIPKALWRRSSMITLAGLYMTVLGVMATACIPFTSPDPVDLVKTYTKEEGAIYAAQLTYVISDAHPILAMDGDARSQAERTVRFAMEWAYGDAEDKGNGEYTVLATASVSVVKEHAGSSFAIDASLPIYITVSTESNSVLSESDFDNATVTHNIPTVPSP